MPSFQISDPESHVAGAPDGNFVRAAVPFVVENLTPVNRTGVLRIVPENPAEQALFSLQGAEPTNPSVRTVDFAPRQVLTVTVNAALPAGPAAASSGFRLRATLESDPDNDSIESRPVIVEAAAIAAAAPPPPKEPFPWWALIAAIILVLVVGGGVTWLLWPKGIPTDVPGLAAYFRAHPELSLNLWSSTNADRCFGDDAASPAVPTPGVVNSYDAVIIFGAKFGQDGCPNGSIIELDGVGQSRYLFGHFGDVPNVKGFLHTNLPASLAVGAAAPPK